MIEYYVMGMAVFCFCFYHYNIDSSMQFCFNFDSLLSVSIDDLKLKKDVIAQTIFWNDFIIFVSLFVRYMFLWI